MHGAESIDAAGSKGLLSSVLNYFNDVDDDEILRLSEQGISTYRRVEGSLSPNVGNGMQNMAVTYHCRARRAHAANDLDRCMTNLELALTHLLEAVRIYRAINHVETVDDILRQVTRTEEDIRRLRIAIAEAATAASTQG